MKTSSSFWSVLLSFWAALLFCIIYAAGGYAIISFLDGGDEAFNFLKFFVSGYSGLVTGTASATLFLMSISILRLVPQLIEDAISDLEIERTAYRYWKARFESFPLGLAQFTTYFLAGFAIYSVLGFPVEADSKILLVLFTSLQYALGGFVGRKLWCLGHMLRSLETVLPKEDILETEALPRLIYIVNIFSFLTLVMTAIHTYFHAHIKYVPSSELANILQPVVYLPLILAMPVIVLFNFFPRMIVNQLYLKSIRQRKDRLSRRIERSDESDISKFKHTIDYEKYLNEEFRYRQRVALSELPVALSVILALIAVAVRLWAT
jgi:hypothetical protein